MHSIEIDTDGYLGIYLRVCVYAIFLVNVSQRQYKSKISSTCAHTTNAIADLICTILSYIYIYLTDDDEWFTHFYVLLLLL